MIQPGALLDDRYRLEQRIGAGGAGEVWRARHVTLGSIVAIKVLHVGASHREVTKKRPSPLELPPLGYLKGALGRFGGGDVGLADGGDVML